MLVSFKLVSKQTYDQYCNLERLGPPGTMTPPTPLGFPRLLGPSGAIGPRSESPPESRSGARKIPKRPKRRVVSAADKQRKLDSEAAWDLLERNSKEPFEYQW